MAFVGGDSFPGNAGSSPGEPVVITSRVATQDAIGLITLGGTAQTLFGGVVPPNGYEIINLDGTNVLWVRDDGGTASANGTNCFQVFQQSGDYTTATGMAPAGHVSVVGAVTNQLYSARYW